MSDRLDLLPAAALRPVLARAHRVHLHRLRGVMQQLTGWAALGGAEENLDSLNECVRESSEVLDCLTQLGPNATDFGFEQALTSDWPGRFLGCSLRWGTPTEWEHPLPIEGKAAVATALYLEALLGDADEVRTVMQSEGDFVSLRVQATPLREVEPQLRAALADWVVELDPHEGEIQAVRQLRVAVSPTKDVTPESTPVQPD